MNTRCAVAITTLCIVVSTRAATDFKSTMDVINTISATFKPVLQAPNLYDRTVNLNELVKLSDDLTTYIMKKQGPLNGKKSPRKGNFQGTCALNGSGIFQCDNIFDLWDVYLFDEFTRLINDIKEERLTGNKHGAGFKKLGWHLMAFENITKQLEKIYANSIRSDKKKLADIMLFFTEQNIELIKKANPEL